MFSVVFWLIGLSAGIWWWLDCPPLSVVFSKAKIFLQKLLIFLRRDSPISEKTKISAQKYSADFSCLNELPLDSQCSANDFHEPELGNKHADQVSLKISNLPIIDRTEVEKNLVAGLHRQHYFQRTNNVNHYSRSSGSLPSVDEVSVRERVRAIHSKRFALQQVKPGPLETVVIRPSCRRDSVVKSLTKKESTNTELVFKKQANAFVPSEKVVLLVPQNEQNRLQQIDDFELMFPKLNNDSVIGNPKNPMKEPIQCESANLSLNEPAACFFARALEAEKQPELDGGGGAATIEIGEFLHLHTVSQEPDAANEPNLTMDESVQSSNAVSSETSNIIPVINHEPQAETLPLPFVEPRRMPINYSGFRLPTINLLHMPGSHQQMLDEEELFTHGKLIEEKLAEFKVHVTVADAYAGPVITRYEIEPAVGVRGNQIVNLAKDLARSLGLVSMRVVETIPGKTCMGLELPNPKRQMIRLSEILSSHEFHASKSHLTLALGQDIIGRPIVMDLAKAPHLLVAGTTGSGKSVGVNAMILSMLYKATPEEVRLIMIDPKMLELSVYNDIPHLLSPVVTDMKLAANALAWCVNEMERRYRLMSALGVRNLAGFNQKIREANANEMRIANPFSLTPDDPEPLTALPFIVVVVDEFADLMMVAGKKIEELIARLAQKARAAGIHLILATQRPSVDVITGLIKANIPTRIAFQVSSKVDSRTILDQMGAEALLGQGDMLFLPPGTGYPLRVHGAFVADDEVHRVSEYLKQFGEPDYVEDLLHAPEAEENNQVTSNRSNIEDDPLYDEAVALVLKTRKASISSVQRQLRIGYNRAARLIEQMEEAGLVSSMENNGNRTVLAPERGY